MACKHQSQTAYIQAPRPKRGFKPVGTLCLKCWRFTPSTPEAEVKGNG